MLTNSDIEALEDILFAEPWGDDALDFFGLHGAVCASVIGPVSLQVEELFRLATGSDTLPDGKVPDIFAQCVSALIREMTQSLDMGQPLELPEPRSEEHTSELQSRP